MAGQPSKVGGQVTRVFGWITLVFGTLLAAGLFAACSAAIGTSAAAAPFVLALPIAIITWVVSYLLLKGGKSLQQSGVDQQKATRTQAVFMLANTRGGMVTPADLAQSIGITPAEADEFLTSMAKESSDNVSIEVDDNGTIFYRFNAAHWNTITSNPANWERPRGSAMAPNASPNVRVAPMQAPPIQTRVDAPPPAPRVDARPPADPIEDEFASEPDVSRRQAR